MTDQLPTSVTTQPLIPIPARSIVTEIAHRFGMEREPFERTLKKTIMPANVEVNNEQLAAFLLVAREYDLNPFTKEIFAFPARGGGIQPVVSIDGWLKIINAHPQFDGMEFKENFEGTVIVSITCIMHRKDHHYPVIVTEYLSECMRPTDQWKQKPIRMLRHKVTIQAARYAFGFAGIVDPDEADRMVEAGVLEVVTPQVATSQRLQHLREKIAPPVVESEDPAPVEVVADESK